MSRHVSCPCLPFVFTVDSFAQEYSLKEIFNGIRWKGPLDNTPAIGIVRVAQAFALSEFLLRTNILYLFNCMHRFPLHAAANAFSYDPMSSEQTLASALLG